VQRCSGANKMLWCRRGDKKVQRHRSCMVHQSRLSAGAAAVEPRCSCAEYRGACAELVQSEQVQEVQHSEEVLR